MKDKRQRLAMTWPCDPAVYAYLVNAAHAATSSYPYVPPPALPTPAMFPPPAQAPFGYYSAGLQRVAAAAAAAASSPPYRPLPVPAGVDAAYSAALLRAGSAATVDRLRRAPAPPSPPTLSPPVTTTVSPGNQKLSSHVVSASSMTSSSKTTPLVTPTLFQPFKLDVERS